MDEEEFKDLFVVQFLASWAANNYDDACRRGEHKKLERMPVEDAEYLADKAWERYEEEIL